MEVREGGVSAVARSVQRSGNRHIPKPAYLISGEMHMPKLCQGLFQEFRSIDNSDSSLWEHSVAL